MHFPRNSTSQKTESKTNRDPPSALFRVVAARCAPRAPIAAARPIPWSRSMEPQRATEERCRGPHPCTWCGRHTRYRAALSRRRSWPIPPANCAEAAHDRWKCVIRTGDKLRFCLRLSVAKNKHLLVWCCCQSSLRAAANTGHASLIPLSLSLFGYAALANIQSFRESQNAACLGFGTWSYRLLRNRISS